jgi:hypothetical protein
MDIASNLQALINLSKEVPFSKMPDHIEEKKNEISRLDEEIGKRREDNKTLEETKETLEMETSLAKDLHDAALQGEKKTTAKLRKCWNLIAELEKHGIDINDNEDISKIVKLIKSLREEYGFNVKEVISEFQDLKSLKLQLEYLPNQVNELVKRKLIFEQNCSTLENRISVHYQKLSLLDELRSMGFGFNNLRLLSNTIREIAAENGISYKVAIEQFFGWVEKLYGAIKLRQKVQDQEHKQKQPEYAKLNNNLTATYHYYPDIKPFTALPELSSLEEQERERQRKQMQSSIYYSYTKINTKSKTTKEEEESNQSDNDKIDNAIVNELNIISSVCYLELKRRFEESLNRTISFDTYNVHLRKMLKENILNKQDDGKRGKSVFYSLTEGAKKQIQLNLLGVNPEQTLFRRIYENLFFYDVYHAPLNVISTEEELDRLLLEFNATRNDLYETFSYNPDGELKFATKYEELSFADTRTTYILGESGVRITKTEYWEANKYYKNRYATEYTFTLPGVSINEFIKNDSLGMKFQRSDVEKAFSLLIKNGLIKPVIVFRNETRFIIADERLRKFIHDLQFVRWIEWKLLMHKWNHHCEPTKVERERMNWLLDEQEMQKIFRHAEMSRYQDKQLMKGRLKFTSKVGPKQPEEYKEYLNQQLRNYESGLNKFVKIVKEVHCKTIQEYAFLHDIIKIVCPMFLN